MFERIFGVEARKPLLMALLNDLLELKGTRRIKSLQHFSPEQQITEPRSKLSVVDVKCTTGSGRRFVVEMQVLPVEGFEKRVVYNASKAYVLQLQGGEDYTRLCDVVGVTICNFKLWPKKVTRSLPASKRDPSLSLDRLSSRARTVVLVQPTHEPAGLQGTLAG